MTGMNTIFHKRFVLLSTALLAVACAICLALVMLVPGEAHAATKVKLNKTSATLLVGKSTTLKLSGAKASKVKWTSSKKSVATVKAGKVKAKKAGKTTITATYKGKKYKCKITVAKLTMSKIGTLYAAGSSYSVLYDLPVVKCYKHGANCSGLKFSSSNKKVVKINRDGYLEVFGPGTATITAKAHGATVKQKVAVKSNYFAMEPFAIRYFGCDDDEYLRAYLLCGIHDNFDDYGWCDAVYTSSNPSVAVIDEDGDIKIKGQGQTTIKAQAHGQTASQVLTVGRPWVVMDSIPDLYYDGEDGYAEAWCGACESRYDSSAVFSSSNPSVVQVDKYGHLTPMGVGSATITARAHGATATRTVNVKLTPFTMSNSTMALSLKRYEDYWLNAELGAQCGICGGWCYKATWTSSNPAIVEVDEYGSLIPKAKGTATITAAAHGASTTCVVTVID